MPLIIILSFVSVLYVAAFEDVFQSTKQQNEDLWRKISDMQETPEGILQDRHKKSLLDLQKQRLINALDKILLEERESLGLYRYKGGRRY